MSREKLLKFFTRLFLCLWFIVTFAALGAMYKLWWDREYHNYFGKNVTEQRQQVWQLAGLKESVLALTEGLNKTWPTDVTYTEKGDDVQLSYSRYILAPRMPSGSDTYWYSTDGTNGPIPPQEDISVSVPSSPATTNGLTGFTLSVLIMFGVARVIQTLLSRYKFSFSEMCGCVALLIMAIVLLAKTLLPSIYPVQFCFVLAGFLSWASIIYTAIRKGSLKSYLLNCHMVFKANTIAWYFCGLLLLVLILSLFWSLLMSVIVVPDDWDAWAIWAVKAKVLALGQGNLQDVTYFGHGDYPLLWPSIWAFSGWLSGGWEEMWSRGWGTVFLFLCLWEMVVIVERITKKYYLGLLCAAIFASMPMVPLVTSWSYAEAPFWLMTISSCGCLLLRNNRFNPTIIIVAALLATGAAYTKNEGILFVVLSFFWIMLLPGQKKYTSAVLFLTVFGILYFPWFYWTKIVLDMGSHATAGLQFDLENMTRALTRVKPALETIFRIWSDVKQWNIVVLGTVCLTFLMLLKTESRKMLFLPLGMLIAYFIIIIFHHAEIYWQVGTSWNRLTLQFMPILLVLLVTQIWVTFWKQKE